MYFKTHRKNKSFLNPHSEREQPQRKSLEIIHQSSTSAKILQQARHSYYQEQQFPKAIQLFEQYLTIFPKNNEALYLCGVAYLHIRRSQEAIEKLKRVTKEYENYSNALLLTAIAFNKLGFMSKSLQYMDFCIKNYPEFQQALCFRGRLHMQNGCFMQAEIDFKAASELISSTFLSFIGLGDCMKSCNRFEKAIKLYEKAQEMLKESHLKQTNSVFYDLELKVGICLYNLQDYQKSLKKLSFLKEIESTKGSQLFYYIGLCYCKLQNSSKAQLNFEYSLKLQTSKKISEKSYKRLLRLYLQNYQFYEANDLVSMAEKLHVDLPHWKKIIEAFMMIIKGHYEEALKEFKQTLSLLKQDKEQKVKIKKSVNELTFLQNRIKVKLVNPSKRTNFFESPLNKEKASSQNKSGRRKSEYFSKSVSKAIAKIGSVCNNKETVRASDILRHKTEHFSSEIAKTTQFKEKKEPLVQLFNAKQKQLMYPLVLKFKAYSEFFLDQYLQSMDTYELYENYLKDMYGKDSDLHYNKLLCEGLLMIEEQLADEALAKFSQCVEYYFQKYHQVPLEPILYKLVLLIKLAVVKMNDEQNSQQDDPEVANCTEILDSTLKMMENYQTAISQSHLAYYFKAVIFILQEEFKKARECLDKTLKLAEQCNWKYLYVKGVVQMTLGNYFGAIKEFSAGLILEARPQLFLGRCISFFMLSEEEKDTIEDDDLQTLMKSVNISAELTQYKDKLDHFREWKGKNKGELLIQSCFSDLQSFVESSNKEAEISLWVTRILYATKSYDQALTSIVKMQKCSYEFMQITECIQIYEGQYQNGGNVGLIIKSAFDGVFLDVQQEKVLLEEKIIKNYNSPEFEYIPRDYQKWLVILHLFVQQKYSLLLKYMQRQLFTVKDDETELFLRYNICVVYLLLGELNKVQNIVKSLMKFEQKFKISVIIGKMLDFQYEQDQCLDELKEILGIGDKRLLSNSLPYREVEVVNQKQEKIKIYLRANIPFPKFPLPYLELKIDKNFIFTHLGPKIVDKKIEAPWIRKTNKNIIQFTDNLEDSSIDLMSLSSKASSSRVLEEAV